MQPTRAQLGFPFRVMREYNIPQFFPNNLLRPSLIYFFGKSIPKYNSSIKIPYYDCLIKRVQNNGMPIVLLRLPDRESPK